MPLLSVDQVGKSYWRGRHEIVVLDDISFELEPGEFVAIFGQRASGKTTLLRIAAGLETPDRGRVRFDDCDLATVSGSVLAASLRRRVGWMRHPGPAMEMLQMVDYVASPLLQDLRRGEARRRAVRALEGMRAGELADARWHELSDAERTLVMIARAVVRAPALVIADDPTMGLSFTEREVVVELLRVAAQAAGTAVLMTAPDLPDMLRSERVMSLSDGELIQAARKPRSEALDFRDTRGKYA